MQRWTTLVVALALVTAVGSGAYAQTPGGGDKMDKDKMMDKKGDGKMMDTMDKGKMMDKKDDGKMMDTMDKGKMMDKKDDGKMMDKKE